MTIFKSIREENIPSWYEISFIKNEPAIILRIHQDWINYHDIIKDGKVPQSKEGLIEAYRQKLNFNKFSGEFNKNFGFEDVFVYLGLMDSFREFKITIPQIEKRTTEKCKECNGTGKNKELNRECLYCQGYGKKSKYDWKKVTAISATFSIFSSLADFTPDKDTSSKNIQLLTFLTTTSMELHGGSLGGSYSILLVDYLRKLGKNSEIPEMQEAMKITFNKLFLPKDYYDNHSFRACVDYENGWLNVDCPGDACGLNPSDFGSGVKEGFGYRFSCHNVDSSAQQLTLIAGLAALSDCVKKSLK